MASEVRRRPVPSYALIIGINDYDHYPKLRGAVADAKAMEQYLKEVLHVPNDHIDTFYDKEANRIAIINAFKKLPDDPRIKQGDPVVIFYAGHGGELVAPRVWWVKKKIQCLIPQDCYSKDPNSTEPVPDEHAPIPDRSIGVSLEELARYKGNNITVILDCCHSASGTREDCVARSVARELVGLEIPEYLDGEIWRGRIGGTAPGFGYHGLRSHVLLAACGEQESAHEQDGRGLFTKELLSILESCAVNKLDLTYTEVLDRIHLIKQRPQCEGLHRHRFLYDTRLPAGRQVWHKAQSENGKYVIEAGLSHGVAPGVEFTLHDKQFRWLRNISVDKASTIKDFETTISTSAQLADISLAQLSCIGKVPLYIGDDTVLEETLQRIEASDPNAANFLVVRQLSEAKLHVERESDLFGFKILDQRLQKLGLTQLPHKATLDNLVHVLGAAAHFFWYLDLENQKSRLGTNDEATFNFYFLKKVYDDYGNPFLIPDDKKPSYCRKDSSLDTSDVIDFAVDPKGRYGMEITNNTKRDLFLNACLFNNSSMSVAQWHTQPSAGKPEPPLKQGGTFTIGYGFEGTPPFTFSLEEGQDLDVGYLKIFFSTLPIDMADVEQASPFSSIHPPRKHDRRDGAQSGKGVLPRPLDIWFTVLIPVIQRRS